MRILYLLLFVVLAGAAKAQITVPEFETHITTADRTHNRKMLGILSQYEFSVTFSTRCPGWRIGPKYKALAYRNNQWHLITLEINNRKNYGKPPYTSTLKQIKGQIVLCDSLVNQLAMLKLYTIDPDSLNFHSKTTDLDSIALPDGSFFIPTELVLGVTDGGYYTFIIKSGRKTRFLHSYEPVRFYAWLPEVATLGRYIDCINAFTRTWKEMTEEQSIGSQ